MDGYDHTYNPSFDHNHGRMQGALSANTSYSWGRTDSDSGYASSYVFSNTHEDMTAYGNGGSFPTRQEYSQEQLVASRGQWTGTDSSNVPRSALGVYDYADRPANTALFDMVVGVVEPSAQLAGHLAAQQLQASRYEGVQGGELITSIEVFEASGHKSEGVQTAVQQVLKTVLHALFHNHQTGHKVSILQGQVCQAIREAAYFLLYQYYMDGTPNAENMCWIPVGMALKQLREKLLQEEGLQTQEQIGRGPMNTDDYMGLNGGELTVDDTLIGSLQNISSGGRGLTVGRRCAERDQARKYHCPFPHQPHKSFRRQADLDRHRLSLHSEADTKLRYPCDYRKCDRHNNPFSRQDHYRDHLRNYHHEDLLRRGAAMDEKWWHTRSSRGWVEGWWRCGKCLHVRVDVTVHGFVCPRCNGHCEPERIKRRLEGPGE